MNFCLKKNFIEVYFTEKGFEKYYIFVPKKSFSWKSWYDWINLKTWILDLFLTCLILTRRLLYFLFSIFHCFCNVDWEKIFKRKLWLIRLIQHLRTVFIIFIWIRRNRFSFFLVNVIFKPFQFLNVAIFHYAAKWKS